MDDKLEEIFGDEVESGNVLEVYDEMVTAMAGSIYSELDKLVGAFGQDAVTGLMPLMVSVLESLATTCACAREREDQLEMVQEDKQRLLIQYDRERDGRKRSEERCMEMEDGIEQERKLFKANLLTMEAQTKNMEMKARSYADQIVGLEEQKALLNKELVSLTQVHAKIVKSYKELRYQRSLSLEAARLSGRNTPLQGVEKKITLLDFQEAPSSLESVPDSGCLETLSHEKECILDSIKANSKVYMNGLPKEVPDTNFLPLGDEFQPQDGVTEKDPEPPQPETQSVVDDIINSTPELKLNSEPFEASTPKEHSDPEEEEIERNNDSLFAEVCGTSPEFISCVDEGADLQGVGNSVDALIVENAQLRDAQSEVDMARKSLIARVEELTAEREALKRETENVTQSLCRCELKQKETEQELQMTRVELDEARKQCRENSEVDIPAAQRKRFTRTEMARVLMERNQYKEKLMELQDAVRRTEMLRASKDVQAVQMKKTSFWKVFDRLFSSSSGPQGRTEMSPPVPQPTLTRVRSASSVMYSAGQGNSAVRNQSVNFHAPNTSHTEDVDAVPLRGKKHEHYRQIRSHIWKEHGRAQLHGWSIPPAIRNRGETQEGSEIIGVPVLVQLRLLDQKDPCTKHNVNRADIRISVRDAGAPPSFMHAVLLDPWIFALNALVCDWNIHNGLSEQKKEIWCACPQLSMDMLRYPFCQRDHGHRCKFFKPRNGSICDSQYTCPVCDLCARLDCSEEQEICKEDDDHENVGGGATIWLGTQEGSLFIHSAVSDWKNCLQKVQLKDAIHTILHAGNRVVATLGDGTLAIFSRNAARNWDLENPRVVDLGRPQQSIRCSVYVHGEVWCGYRNRIYVLDPRTAKIKKWFEATPRTESQVRHIAVAGCAVCVSVRLDSILRLFHAQTGQPLQELELETFIQRMLGSNVFGMSMAQVSALSVFCGFLWVGTTCGVIVAIPFSQETDSQSGQIGENEQSPQEHFLQRSPYCSMENAQVSFHGHRDAVKFFACVPGCINPSLPGGGSENTGNSSILLMSGGEGYINFRIGDETGDTDESYGDLLLTIPRYRRSERSHLIVWQMQT